MMPTTHRVPRRATHRLTRTTLQSLAFCALITAIEAHATDYAPRSESDPPVAEMQRRNLKLREFDNVRFPVLLAALPMTISFDGAKPRSETRVAVAAEVALALLQLRGTQARLAIAQRNLASQQQTLQITQWRQEAGLVTQLDVEQARTAVEQVRAQLPLLAGSSAQAMNALAVLTGRAPGALHAKLAPPSGDAVELPVAPTDLALAIPAEVLRRGLAGGEDRFTGALRSGWEWIASRKLRRRNVIRCGDGFQVGDAREAFPGTAERSEYRVRLTIAFQHQPRRNDRRAANQLQRQRGGNIFVSLASVWRMVGLGVDRLGAGLLHQGGERLQRRALQKDHPAAAGS